MYYKHNKNGDLEGMVSTHIDYFSLARLKKFLDEVTEEIRKTFYISKKEDEKFNFMGIDIEKVSEKIEISMFDYAASLEDIKVREDLSDSNLTRDEMRDLRKYVGKTSWFAANTRPDLAIYALDLAKRQKQATLNDLKGMNRVLLKVREKDSKVVFTKVRRKEKLCVSGSVTPPTSKTKMQYLVE